MLTSLVLWLGGYVLAVPLWGMGYFFTHHTGLELLANILKLRFDWPPAAPAVTQWVEALVLYGLAPFQVGRWAARCWPGREVVVCAAIMLVWPFLVVLVPLVLLSTRVTLPTVPLLQTCLLIGALWERRESLRPAEVESGRGR